MYKFLLKYFYSWYILPLLILHECIHVLIGTLTGLKLTKFKIYKSTVIPVYNGFISFKFERYSWKWFVSLHSPILIFLLPLILSIFYPLFLYFILYLLTTIIIYKNKAICLFFQSSGDIQYKNNIKYLTYLYENTSSDVFYFHYNKNEIEPLVLKFNLLRINEYFFLLDKNKNKNNLYKIKTKIENVYKKYIH